MLTHIVSTPSKSKTIGKQHERQHPNEDSAMTSRAKNLQQSQQASRLVTQAFVNVYAATKGPGSRDLLPIVYELNNRDYSLF